jgi:hypothetical protein
MTSQVSDLTSRRFSFAGFPWPDFGRTGFLDGGGSRVRSTAEVDKLAWDLR